MEPKTSTRTKTDSKDDLKQDIYVAVLAALAAKGVPVDEAIEQAKSYAIAGAKAL